jgi:Uma2 family endonuclease
MSLSHLVDLPLLRIPASAVTLAGFRAWVTSDDFIEQFRASFIDREIFLDMSPEELETHSVVKNEVSRVISGLVRELRLGKFYPDGTLVTNQAADLSTEPDGTFVTRESLKAGRVRLVARKGRPGQYIELEGTPDWVLEVVSQSSVQKDKKRLRLAYHRAGIPEYWLIDARGERIVFQILRRSRADYRAVAHRGGWYPSRVFGRSFRLDRERDELGLWEYTLQVQ